MKNSIFPRWDEWVELDRIVGFNYDGLNLQKKLSEEHAAIDSKVDEKEVITCFDLKPISIF